jgi:hypothetical protein
MTLLLDEFSMITRGSSSDPLASMKEQMTKKFGFL